jgi:FlaA1/EpsC-like NDP-sugar epimerase
MFLWAGIYRMYWRNAGLSELNLLLMAAGLSTAILTTVFVVAHASLFQWKMAIYRSVPFIDGFLTFVVMAGFRFGLRGLSHNYRQYRGVVGGRRALLVGAGEAGTMIAKELRANPQLNLEPVAFVDDDAAKQGTRVEGVPVVGTCSQIPRMASEHQVQRIIVTMPSTRFSRLQEIVGICQGTGLVTHNLPGLYELLAGHKIVSRRPEVDINRLLRRRPVQIDETGIAAYLAGARVLVTGAGGSIGRELCRQIARFGPEELMLLGHGENSIFECHLDLGLSFPDLVRHPVIADVRDAARINWAMDNYQPDVIFHAAAHKHVPLMETCVGEALTNNVLGTHNVLCAAETYGIPRFVLISTDKAVYPTSVMGATKRMAELLVLAAARRSGRNYVAVRFGNVLGSRGSVVTVFQQQIAAAGPLTVTHPEMCRYFMTIPEAVQLVLQAGALGRGGEVYVLDMGEPLRILDLARNLIRLAGLEPMRDIQIVFTGLRPGEKLSEQLFLEQERCRRTRHPRVLVASCDAGVDATMLEKVVLEVVDVVQAVQAQNGNEMMRELLPQICQYLDRYQPESPPALPESIAAPEHTTPVLRLAPT